MTLAEFAEKNRLPPDLLDRFVGYLAREMKAPASQVYALHYVPGYWAEAWRCFKGGLRFGVRAK